MYKTWYKAIGILLIIFSFIYGVLLLFIAINTSPPSDDFIYWGIALVISFSLLFFPGRKYLKVANETDKDSKLVFASSITAIIGLAISIIIILTSMLISEGFLLLLIIFPFFFGLFF